MYHGVVKTVCEEWDSPAVIITDGSMQSRRSMGKGKNRLPAVLLLATLAATLLIVLPTAPHAMAFSPSFLSSVSSAVCENPDSLFSSSFSCSLSVTARSTYRRLPRLPQRYTGELRQPVSGRLPGLQVFLHSSWGISPKSHAPETSAQSTPSWPRHPLQGPTH